MIMQYQIGTIFADLDMHTLLYGERYIFQVKNRIALEQTRHLTEDDPCPLPD